MICSANQLTGFYMMGTLVDEMKLHWSKIGKILLHIKNYAKQGVDRQVSFAQKTPKGCPGVAPGKFCDC